MKKSIQFICLFAITLLFSWSITSQTTYTYPLSNSFNGNEAGAPVLEQIPNNSGLTGEFISVSVPATTCEQSGTAKGYFFEDDAGLQFNNPEGFINAGVYSLSMIFHFDEFISPPAWVRILSFTHDDDYGIYILLTSPPTNGTLDFWPHGAVGVTDFFNTVDFYQLILVRNAEGMVTVYINGSEFASYDDSSTEEYLPQPGKNYLKFFRDHPSVLADEASPGFVSDIVITNGFWTPQQVAAKWDEFCGSLLSTDELAIEEIKVFPIPAEEHLTIELPANGSSVQYSIYDITGKLVEEAMSNESSFSIDVSNLHAGLYILKLELGSETRMLKFTKR